MSSPLDIRDGYIRAQADLKLLDSAAVVLCAEPKWGYLELLTSDGRLQVKITQACAEDLLVDLQLFLKATTPSHR